MKCLHPSVINRNGQRRLVNCGHCAWCRQKKRDEWYLRFSVESQKNIVLFLTLTYSDEFLPVEFLDLDTGEILFFRGFVEPPENFIYSGSVPYKDDLQKYFKRVRKNTNEKLKYYVVSEHGSQNGRVHYHALVFCQNNIIDELVDNWHYGDAVCEVSRNGALMYVNKYMFKDVGKNSLVPEIHYSSHGIGSSLTPDLLSYYLSDDYKGSFNYLGEYHSLSPYYSKKLKDLVDNSSDSVKIEFVRDSKGNMVVRNRHCDLVRDLAESRMEFFIPDKDSFEKSVISSAKSSNIPPNYLFSDLYNRDFKKQDKISISND